MNTWTRRLTMTLLTMAALGLAYLALQRMPAEAPLPAAAVVEVVQLPRVMVTARRDRVEAMALPVVELPQVRVVARRADLIAPAAENRAVGLAQDRSAATRQPG